MVKRSRQQDVPKPAGEDLAFIPKLRIMIALPCHDKVDSVFAYDLTQLAIHSTMAFTATGVDIEFGITMVTSTYIHEAREQLMTEAVNGNFSHVLWVDGDMRFPKTSLLRLLSRKQPIVGANYSTRTAPPSFVAIKEIYGDRVRTTNKSRGIERVEALGFGLCLMDLRAFREKLADLQPLFGFRWLEDRKKWMGEDVFFFLKMKEIGVDVFVDHDLSKEVAHVGDLEYQTLGVEEWEKLS